MNNASIIGLIAALAVIGTILFVAKQSLLHKDSAPTNNNGNNTRAINNRTNNTPPRRPNNDNNNNRTRNSTNNAPSPADALELRPESQQQQEVSQATLRSKVIKVLFPEEKIDESKLRYDSEANSYRWTRVSERNSTSCCICLEGFQEGDLILSGHCSHIYHRECVMAWVEKNDSCPVCRQPIFDEATYKAVEQQIIHLDV